jgi:amino acid transporter
MADEKLVRGIGRWDFTAIVINTIIGAGIFGLPSKAAALIGSHSIYAFAFCGIIVSLIVLCYAEVSSRFDSTGGPYLYAHTTFGEITGFEVGWLYWIVRVVTFAANCNLFVTYLGFFIPSASETVVRMVIVGIVVVLLTVVNLVGVRQSALATNIFTVGKIVPLLVFAVVGVFFIDPGNFNFAVAPTYSDFSSAVLLLFYAFVGFEAAVVLGGEVKEPQRNIPFGLFAALGIVAFIYMSVQIVSIGTFPGIATSERPIADASALFMGPVGAGLITVGALLSIIGNLNVGLLASTRMLYSMADNRQLPQFIARTHPRSKTPYVSIILTGIVIFVLTVASSFLVAVAIATITRLIVYATTCLALPLLRRRDNIPPAQFKPALGVPAAIISIILTIWLLTNVDFAKEGVAILIMAAVGIMLYGAGRLLNRNGKTDENSR